MVHPAPPGRCTPRTSGGHCAVTDICLHTRWPPASRTRMCESRRAAASTSPVSLSRGSSSGIEATAGSRKSTAGQAECCRSVPRQQSARTPQSRCSTPCSRGRAQAHKRRASMESAHRPTPNGSQKPETKEPPGSRLQGRLPAEHSGTYHQIRKMVTELVLRGRGGRI